MEAKEDPNAYTVLMTNRLKRLSDLVFHHLDVHGMTEFDYTSFGDEYRDRKTKPQRLGQIMNTIHDSSPERITKIFAIDDMEDQIMHYLEMREGLEVFSPDIKVFILQVNEDGTITKR